MICPGSWIFGCKYEPRYDSKPPKQLPTFLDDFNHSDAVVNIIDSLSTKTYVYDICIHCGDIVNRNMECSNVTNKGALNGI